MVLFELLIDVYEVLGAGGIFRNLESANCHYPPEQESLSLLVVKMSFMEFPKNPQGKLEVSSLVRESLKRCSQSLKPTTPSAPNLQWKVKCHYPFSLKKRGRVDSLTFHSLKKF